MSKLPLKLLLLASVMALPLAAAAQDKSGGFDVSDAPPAAVESGPQIPAANQTDITLGWGVLSPTSAYFGRYNGEPLAGPLLTGAFDLRHRDAWDSGGAHYLSLTGVDLYGGNGKALPEASIGLKVGNQGKWWMSADYSAITYVSSYGFTTILQPNGQLTPGYLNAVTNAGAFVSNSATPNLPGATFYGTTYKPNATSGIASSAGSHLADYGPQNETTLRVGTRRDKGSAAAGFMLGSWQFSVGLSHEHKQGSLEQAMTTGGSNAGFLAFAEPINYDTDIFTATAAYTTQKLQTQFSYEMSSFIDNNSAGYAFQGWNFTNVKDPVTGKYTAYELSGVYSLPPSNSAHNFTAALGYNVNSVTRINATMVYGLQIQNDPFVSPTLNAYTLNVNGVALNNTKGVGAEPFGLNPASLNGWVATWFGSVAASSHPVRKLELNGRYSIDVRDPHTQPMWIYGDATDALRNAANAQYRQAVPESWTKQQLALTAGYELLPETRLTAGYTYRDAWRGNAITHHAKDSEENVKLQTLLSNGTTASVGYVHAERTTSAPDFSLWLVQIQSDCGSTLALLGCQQVPFYEAARTQDAVTGILGAPIGQKASFSLYSKWEKNHYTLPAAVYNGVTSPGVGINQDTSLTIAPDLTYQATDDNDVHLFYTYLRTSRAMSALNNQSVVGGGATYAISTLYEIHTAGLSLNHRLSKTVKVGADYIYSYGNLGWTQSGTWDNNEVSQTYGGDPYLANKSTNNEVKAHLSWTVSPRMTVFVSYRFDSLDMTDWALIGATAGQVLTGDIPARYNVSTFIGAVRWTF